MNKILPVGLSFFIAILMIPVFAFADAYRIFKDNSKAVVVVVTYDEKGEPISQGSGFIVRPDGAVVTNYHVISNAKDIKVKVGDKILDVEGLIHTDKENDLVILKVKGEKLPVVKLGDILKVNVGEKVYVISSPEGLENTISDGLLSGIREIASDKKVLQITAPISPGSSGGPVFNKDGEVIGVATFLIKEAQNINFAMPVNLLKDKIGSKKFTALKETEIEDYEKTAEFWFYLGYIYGESGMYREAIESFKQAMEIKPNYVDGHYNLGVAYSKSGMLNEARDAFKQAIQIKPDYAKAHHSLGITYHKEGMWKEAIDAFKTTIQIKPDYAKAHYNLGITYRESGMLKEAIEAYKHAIRINPDYVEAHTDLGVAYAELGMLKEEIESYKQAIRVNPDYAEAHYNLGVAYILSGMLKEATNAFKQAIRIKHAHAIAHYNLGIIYSTVDDKGSALDEYKILKSLDPELANKLFNEIYE